MNTFRFSLLFGALIFVLGSLSSCKEETTPAPGELTLTPKAYFNNEPLVIGDLYTDILGHTVRVENFKCYIAEITAIEDSGVEHELAVVDLVDFENPIALTYTLPSGNYTGFRVSIGVPPELNKDQDPAQYESDHPLSLYGAEGMFWSWGTGYIFTKFDGKANFAGENDPILDPYAFHCGEDFLYTTLNFGRNFCVGEETASLELRFNVEKFFYNANDTIDIQVDNFTHTNGNVPLAERFSALFNEAIELH
jgi:hypothetical protein